MIEKVKRAALSMQRYNWEQGVLAQAFLEAGEMETAILFAIEAAHRQDEMGRCAAIGPAFSAHDFTDRMSGAYPLSDKHYTVYFTAYTPLERVIKIRAGRKDRHL